MFWNGMFAGAACYVMLAARNICMGVNTVLGDHAPKPMQAGMNHLDRRLQQTFSVRALAIVLSACTMTL